jgi:hypothetical protein
VLGAPHKLKMHVNLRTLGMQGAYTLHAAAKFSYSVLDTLLDLVAFERSMEVYLLGDMVYDGPH